MTTKQIAHCVEKLAAISPQKAERFEALQAEAGRLAFAAVEMRREAWAIYHEHFPKKK